jgi:hypothetical protein
MDDAHRFAPPALTGGDAVAARSAGVGDFAFEEGHWAVRHRKLRKRLADSSDWLEFDGTCVAGQMMAGAACYEDNLLNDPDGAYRAAAVRRLDWRTGLWSIWWWDERVAGIDPPLTGRFVDGVGTFFGESLWAGTPIRVRYIWDHAAPGVPRWQQAFSADQGATWETNWFMEFRR